MEKIERNAELESMMIQFYNMQAGTRFQKSNECNRLWAYNLICSFEGKVIEAKIHIKEFVRENKEYAATTEGFNECFNLARPKLTTPEPLPANDGTVGGALDILSQALLEVVKNQSIPQIEKDIKSECTKMLQDFIKKEYGTIERKIVTVIDGKMKEQKGELDPKFATIVKYVSNKFPVFLTGPAGCGKNYICKQVADALNLKFYFSNAITQEYKITGFTDANGNYQPTQFYYAFTGGGLYMIDEMDASIPEVLIILNAALANGYFDFPAPIGHVEAHPDFRVIAAGNTTGHGADYEYVGRNQLDAATLNRFGYIEIDYRENIENSLAGDIELADFCREFRNAAKKAGIQIIVSYREISRLATMTQLLDLTEALQTGLVKSLSKDDLNIICNELHASKYKDALRKLVA